MNKTLTAENLRMWNYFIPHHIPDYAIIDSDHILIEKGVHSGIGDMMQTEYVKSVHIEFDYFKWTYRPVTNTRILISRNKREGKFFVKKYGKYHRSKYGGRGKFFINGIYTGSCFGLSLSFKNYVDKCIQGFSHLNKSCIDASNAINNFGRVIGKFKTGIKVPIKNQDAI